MEDILDLYTAEHNEEEPLIAMDEASKQLLAEKEGHEPIPLQPGQVAKSDYHYERRGVQALFIFFDPIRNWRRVSNRDQRTQIDWALEIKQLLEMDYPHARKIKLVCDNLNTHTFASLYAAFPAEEARRLARRLEIHHTPRNGSWLNIAEIELSVLAQQCLDRRIPTADKLNQEITAWQNQRNLAGGTVVWRFTNEQARTKLRHLYPCTVLS